MRSQRYEIFPSARPSFAHVHGCVCQAFYLKLIFVQWRSAADFDKASASRPMLQGCVMQFTGRRTTALRPFGLMFDAHKAPLVFFGRFQSFLDNASGKAKLEAQFKARTRSLELEHDSDEAKLEGQLKTKAMNDGRIKHCRRSWVISTK